MLAVANDALGGGLLFSLPLRLQPAIAHLAWLDAAESVRRGIGRQGSFE